MLNGFLENAKLQGLIEQLDSNWQSLIVDNSELPNLKEILYSSGTPEISISRKLMTSEDCEMLKDFLSTYHDPEYSQWNQLEWTVCKSMTFKGNNITPFSYHQSNSQITYHITPNPILPSIGRVLSIFYENKNQKYFLFVEAFRALDESDQERNPYTSLGELNGQMVYQQNGHVSVIHQDMIQGFYACIPYESHEAGTKEDVFCVVSINYYVSIFLIPKIKKYKKPFV